MSLAEAEENQSQDICRVCRCEGTLDRPLFHPCICTGSIKFIHQECLLQWLEYSMKEYCELCNHNFSFMPIYSSDMPKRLPLSMVLSGFLGTVAKALRFWLHYTLVALAWLGVVPLTACRIYRTLFTGSVSSILSLPINVFSTEDIMWDILMGCLVVTLTLLAFIGLVWLREQILNGGGPEWLEMDFLAARVLEDVVPPHLDDAVEAVEARPFFPPDGPLDWFDEEEREERAEHLAGIQPDLPQANPFPVEPAAPEIDPDVNVAAQPAHEAPVDPDPAQPAGGEVNLGDDGQWNPMEWDRAAEELTWERLLGLDGSLVFLEHVFWVVSLNTLFILVFAFCPYHIGHFTIMGFKLKKITAGAHFEGMLITLCGYCVIGLSLIGLHMVAGLLRFRKLARFMGLCYVVVKVSLLIVLEIVAFPVICGYWLDICSLSLFDGTLKDRQNSYHQSPMTSIFIHWIVGMVYVFYFASFVILLRKVLRPGVLWFLRNLNDPDFNPIQEMIHLSILRHLRRFCASLVMFGTSILIMLYLPSRIIKNVFPTFLPYRTAQVTESQVDDLAMELLLLLVILPAVQDQSPMWLKNVITAWCNVAAWFLNLRSYLFGEPDPATDATPADAPPADGGGAPEPVAQPRPQLPNPGGLGAAHQALLQREGPSGSKPYTKPSCFPIRIAGLVILMVATLLFASLGGMLIPVWVGRQAFSVFITKNHKIYELYTSGTGLYLCHLMIKGITLVISWMQQGWEQMSHKAKQWGSIGLKASVAFFLLLGVIPLMFGFLLDLVVLMPIRVPLNQSPIYFLYQDWAIGAMYTKITIALLYIGPDWWLKGSIERLFQDGLRGIDLTFIVPNLGMPVCATLGLALAVPYVMAHSLAPLVVHDEEILIMTQRRIYPFLVLLIVLVGLTLMQLKQCRKLYEHIKNDRYLVGRRLVNYNHQVRKVYTAPAELPTS